MDTLLFISDNSNESLIQVKRNQIIHYPFTPIRMGHHVLFFYTEYMKYTYIQYFLFLLFLGKLTRLQSDALCIHGTESSSIVIKMTLQLTSAPKWKQTTKLLWKHSLINQHRMIQPCRSRETRKYPYLTLPPHQSPRRTGRRQHPLERFCAPTLTQCSAPFQLIYLWARHSRRRSVPPPRRLPKLPSMLEKRKGATQSQVRTPHSRGTWQGSTIKWLP